MKYRIINEYSLFYPQVKFCFWWQSVEEPNYGYAEQHEALEAIRQHNRIFGKNSNKKNVVWMGEME